jgi:adenosylcobinamide-phosphate synthase
MTLIVAMILDALMGEPRWVWQRMPHPAVLMGRAVAWCDHRLNHGANRKAKGVIALLFLCLGHGVIGIILGWFGPLAECLTVAVLLAQRSLVQHVAAVADGLRLSLTQGRRAVAMIVSRDTRAMTPDETARAAIESAAENMSDGVIAPAFWFLIAGLPGILVYKCVNTADSMIGYRNEQYRDFGWAAARFDDLLNLVPARLTALLFALQGRTPDLQGIARDAAQHKSPNAGWPEAALSRTLGIALAGPRVYHGTLQQFAWVNQSGRRHLDPVDIDTAVTALWRGWGIMLGIVGITWAAAALF